METSSVQVWRSLTVSRSVSQCLVGSSLATSAAENRNNAHNTYIHVYMYCTIHMYNVHVQLEILKSYMERCGASLMNSPAERLTPSPEGCG